MNQATTTQMTFSFPIQILLIQKALGPVECIALLKIDSHNVHLSLIPAQFNLSLSLDNWVIWIKSTYWQSQYTFMKALESISRVKHIFNEFQETCSPGLHHLTKLI